MWVKIVDDVEESSLSIRRGEPIFSLLRLKLAVIFRIVKREGLTSAKKKSTWMVLFLAVDLPGYAERPLRRPALATAQITPFAQLRIAFKPARAIKEDKALTLELRSFRVQTN